MKKLFGTFSIFFLVLVAKANPRVTVELPLGKLEGEEQKSLHGKKFYSFQGVPYAAPPTGQNRFKEPQEVQKWTGTKVAKDNSTLCTQLTRFSSPVPPYKVEGEEDCLLMNFFTSSLDQTANLDVIVYIHAGGFMYGSGYATGPIYLLEEKIVFITFNYRVGALGFLSTEDEVVPGNMGMLDQLMAMKFAKKYAKYFGGNPESITLIGDSTGGFSVHFHMLSPLSKGLFKRAAAFSGTMLHSSALAENSREKAEKMAALLNCSRSSMQEAVDCMRTKPVNEVVGTGQQFLVWMYNPSAPFGIVIDSWAKNPSLPEHPLKLIQQGKVQKVPWIVSHTNSEGLLPACDYYYDSILDVIDEQWNAIMPHILDYNYTVKPSLRDSVSQKIRKYYLGDKNVTKDSFLDLVQMFGDRIFTGDTVKAVKLHLKYVEDTSIQMYMFSYRGTDSQCYRKTPTYENFGACHLDDVSYALNSINFDAAQTERDRRMVKVMVKMIVSFAKNGTADVGMEWPKVTKEKLHRLHISGPDDLKIDEEVFTNATFWDSLPIMENEKLFE